MFIEELPFAILIACGVLVGLYLSNVLYDAGIKHWISRKIGHLAGAIAIIMAAYMFTDWIWPFILATGFLLLLFGAKIFKPATFRGVGGSGRPEAYAEVWYPLSMAIVIPILWGIYNEPFVAAACCAMMGAGDAITGFVRSRYCPRPQKHWSGTVAMFLCCLLLAWAFVEPIQLGIAMAIGATITEYICGEVSPIKWLRWADDNLTIPLSATGIYLLGLTLGV